MGGYKTSDVDGFFDDVAESYEQLYKENSELLKKLRLLVDNIEEYRRKEQFSGANADETLLNANEEAERIITQAKLEAERIITDATEKSLQIGDCNASLDEVRALREKEEQALANVRAESEKFRKSLLSMYTEHLTLIQSMVDGKASAQSTNKQSGGTPSYEKKLDVQTAQVDEKFVYDDIDAFFAEAVAQENSRIKEAFGGFKFEMGGAAQDVQPQESVSDFEEPAQAENEHLTVHNVSETVAETADDVKPDEIKPGFKISFPDAEETSDNDEENLDDLFAGFFNNDEKPE